jgi:hypothetical protein
MSNRQWVAIDSEGEDSAKIFEIGLPSKYIFSISGHDKNDLDDLILAVAAPQLVEALGGLISACEMLGGGYSEIGEALLKANAAIAKATGGKT